MTAAATKLMEELKTISLSGRKIEYKSYNSQL